MSENRKLIPIAEIKMQEITLPKQFPCTSCGRCCKTIGAVIWAAKSVIKSDPNSGLAKDKWTQQIAAFPYEIKNGTCSKLKNGKCSIYDHRPDVCNIAKVHKMSFSDMPIEEYHRRTAESCNQMIKNAGLPNEYLVILEP